MGLMSTAAFGLQNILVKLAGPVGFIFLAISALAAFTLAAKKSKDEIITLEDAVSGLAGQFKALKNAGIDTSFTEEKLKIKTKELIREIFDLDAKLLNLQFQLRTGLKYGELTTEQEKKLGAEIRTVGVETEKKRGAVRAYSDALKDLA